MRLLPVVPLSQLDDVAAETLHDAVTFLAII